MVAGHCVLTLPQTESLFFTVEKIQNRPLNAAGFISDVFVFFPLSVHGEFRQNISKHLSLCNTGEGFFPTGFI